MSIHNLHTTKFQFKFNLEGNSNDLEILKNAKERAGLERLLLSTQDLSGLSFEGKNLSGLDFTGKNCRDCNFESADLSYANFTKATLTGAKYNNQTIFNGTGFSNQTWINHFKNSNEPNDHNDNFTSAKWVYKLTNGTGSFHEDTSYDLNRKRNGKN